MTIVDIERLAYGGDGVGRLPDGRTVFVPGTCPGDTVALSPLEDHGRFARAEALEIVTASDSRVVPPCPYAGRCGGCSWQHVAYETQLEAKHDAVRDAFKRIGHLELAAGTVREVVVSRQQYGYRNKIELVSDPASTRPLLGFHRAGSEEFVAVDECLLLPKKHRKTPKSLSGALRYLAGSTDLGLFRVAVRVAAHTRDVEVALWTRPGPFPRAAAARTLADALPMTSLVRVLSKSPTRERRPSGVEVLSGKGHWKERLSGTTYAVSAPSFFQVNSAAAEDLVSLVLRELDPDGSDRVLDLYAGAGTFTVPLAEVAGEVVAIESAGPAVRDLRRNLESNGVWAEVVGGDAAREIDACGHFDLVVVDPPRAGLDAAVIAALAARRPRAIVYVSCDPATLARDAARLCEADFMLMSATPVDLFPQTYHIETVARFEPRQPKTPLT